MPLSAGKVKQPSEMGQHIGQSMQERGTQPAFSVTKEQAISQVCESGRTGSVGAEQNSPKQDDNTGPGPKASRVSKL
jgi:hypothetical protein